MLADTTVIGGVGGNQGVILNLTAGQAGGLTLNDSGSVRLAAGASSTAAPTKAVTMAAGSGPLSISSVLIGGTSAAANFSTRGTDYSIRATAGTLTFSDGITPFGGSKVFDIYRAGTVVFNGVITDTASGTTSISRIAGTGNTGTLTLAAANTYTGATTIGAGTLLVTNTSGSTTGTGNVAINATGTLAGGSGAANSGATRTLGGASRAVYTAGVLGLVAGPVTVASDGRLAPGNAAVGTLTLGALTLSTGSTATFEFNATTNDFVAVTGALTLSGNSSLTLLQEGTTTAYATAGLYDLFSYGTG